MTSGRHCRRAKGLRGRAIKDINNRQAIPAFTCFEKVACDLIRLKHKHVSLFSGNHLTVVSGKKERLIFRGKMERKCDWTTNRKGGAIKESKPEHWMGQLGVRLFTAVPYNSNIFDFFFCYSREIAATFNPSVNHKRAIVSLPFPQRSLCSNCAVTQMDPFRGHSGFLRLERRLFSVPQFSPAICVMHYLCRH